MKKLIVLLAVLFVAACTPLSKTETKDFVLSAISPEPFSSYSVGTLASTGTYEMKTAPVITGIYTLRKQLYRDLKADRIEPQVALDLNTRLNGTRGEFDEIVKLYVDKKNAQADIRLVLVVASLESIRKDIDEVAQ